MAIKVIKNPITKKELGEIAKEMFGNLVKAVVDVEHEIMAIGGEFHSEEQAILIEHEGSKNEHTWGINLYPAAPKENFIEFDSMVNLKPAFGNRSRGVGNKEIEEKIRAIVIKLILE